jgi:phenylalanyl-tRNA synthetase beta chain
VRVPLRWLREYVEITLSADEIARRLTMSGTEVGYVKHVGADWDRVEIGRAAQVRRHENSDTLTIVEIDFGHDRSTLVTAATNVREGMVLPVVRAGGALGPDLRIDARRFRGVMSEGMLCAGEELGISPDKDRIYVLEDDAPVGVMLADYLGDEVLDIELTPNRADCLGIIGIAREVSVLTGAPLRLPEPPLPLGTREVGEYVKVFVDDPDLCPRYTAGYIEGVQIGPSPQWMQRRLYLCGVRSINNVVDITNYVMLELGQPLHAFDAERLGENTIRVRRARPGERLVTIDGVDRELNDEALVIADAEIPVGLAGVMGGLNSEISDQTTRIVLESANFDPLNIRRTSRALRLSSEASKRFDKGLDVNLPPLGARRALALMAELAGGSTATGLVDVGSSISPRRSISFSVGDVVGLIGQDYSAPQIESILAPLGFEVDRHDERFDVQVPSWRADVEGKADIAEEVSRIFGYDAIPTTIPNGQLPPAAENAVLRWGEAVRNALAGAGLQEVMTYTLFDAYALARLDAEAVYPPAEPDTGSIPVHNPMSSEQSRLRTTLLPSLFSTIASNLRFQRRVAIFEMAKVFLPPMDPLPSEPRRLTIAMAGSRFPESWAAAEGQFDFFDLKAAIEAACGALRVTPSFSPTRAGWLHPGQAAELTIDGQVIGVLGQVHPRVAGRFDVEGVSLYAAELDLDRLLSLAREEITVQSLPRYPGVERDIALVLEERFPHTEVAQAIREAGGSLLERLALFDVYRGAPVPEGHRSLAYALTFRAPDRTLADQEVSSAMQAIEQAVTARFSGRIRGR